MLDTLKEMPTSLEDMLAEIKSYLNNADPNDPINVEFRDKPGLISEINIIVKAAKEKKRKRGGKTLRGVDRVTQF